jgi:hypothetical protein
LDLRGWVWSRLAAAFRAEEIFARRVSWIKGAVASGGGFDGPFVADPDVAGSF